MSMSSSELIGNSISVFRRSKIEDAKTSTDTSAEIKDKEKNRANLLDHYLAFLLLVFVEAGLLEVRVSLKARTLTEK